MATELEVNAEEEDGAGAGQEPDAASSTLKAQAISGSMHAAENIAASAATKAETVGRGAGAQVAAVRDDTIANIGEAHESDTARNEDDDEDQGKDGDDTSSAHEDNVEDGGDPRDEGEVDVGQSETE